MKKLLLFLLVLSLLGCGETNPCENLNGECENWGLYKTTSVRESGSNIKLDDSLIDILPGDNPYVRTKEEDYEAEDIYRDGENIYISTPEGIIHYAGDDDGKMYDVQDSSGFIMAKDQMLILKDKSIYKLNPDGKTTIISDDNLVGKVLKMTSSPNGIVYAALDDGKIMRSDDLGDTWQQISYSPGREVTDIYANDDKVYVGTKSNGLEIYQPS